LDEYIEIELTLRRPDGSDQELMLAWLSHYGFEGFMEEEGRILAYMPLHSYDDENFRAYLEDRQWLDKMASLEVRILPDRNWNEIWEHSYKPVRIGSKCVIRAPFHPVVEEGVEHAIIIAPKMSFGTAHHETTRGMIQMMFSLDMKGKTILDLGCGTGVLAILAEKMGAASVLALDHDPWAYRNAMENVALNACSRIRVREAGISFIRHQTFDIILSNLNLNSLLGLMDQFPGRLRPGGILMLSGFFSGDLPRIDQAAVKNGLEFVADQVINNWAVAVYGKAV
jgi:ribosomal protein L11 methyltransferase